MDGKITISTLLLTLSLLVGCSAKGATNGQIAQTQQTDTTANLSSETFNADSAYSFVKSQCDFGARVPGTKAHSDCAQWLYKKLAQYCDTAIVQRANLTTFDGVKVEIQNIIGVFNPKAERRLLLLAHWDSRPWADQDPDKSKRKEPVMGANDGASGVGVLLEIARQLQLKHPDKGVDILLTDLEDWGTDSDDDSWAMGARYWAQHPHTASYHAEMGILLDMVGDANARFYWEYYSANYAPSMLHSLWVEASEAGYGQYFIQEQGGAINDDHMAIIKNTDIPCIDIIDLNHGDGTLGFPPYWHTTHDTIDKISIPTLKAVGSVVLKTLY